MSINQKKEQIKEYEELAHLQEIGLQKSMHMLEQDAETFKKFVEENKNQTRIAIKIAEDESKKKQERIQELKQLNENLSTIMSKNTKQLERLEKLYTYKLFLDRLTPAEFLQQQKEKKEKRKKEKLLKFHADDIFQESEKKFNWQIYNINLSPGIIDLLNDSDDDFEMYFKDPSQLQELFNSLESDNLFIIKYTRDCEQNLEDLKHDFENKKQALLEKREQNLRSKAELEKSIQVRGEVKKLIF